MKWNPICVNILALCVEAISFEYFFRVYMLSAQKHGASRPGRGVCGAKERKTAEPKKKLVLLFCFVYIGAHGYRVLSATGMTELTVRTQTSTKHGFNES